MVEIFFLQVQEAALRYEVGLSILGGEICWISGPYQPGVYNDIEIFWSSLESHLDEFERV